MSGEALTKLGKYELKHELARGTMGAVYEAYDPMVGRAVAVKVALSDALRDPESSERLRQLFFNEAHAAGLLRHENILEVFDAGVDQEQCYIVMELVGGGKTLREHCRPDSLLPLDKAIEVVFRCALALDYAHSQGVIHRDIKPSNILMSASGTAKIADFSIAHLNREDTSATMPMGFVGSPRFMSPEQIQEDVVTSQTDLFSLGVIAYQLFCGHHPFGGETFSSLVYRIVNEPPRPIAEFRADLPPALSMVLGRALAKDPRNRFASGAEFAAALAEIQPGLTGAPRRSRRVPTPVEASALAFFRDLPAAEITLLLREGLLIDFMPGQTVLHSDSTEGAIYVVMQGLAEVHRARRVLTRIGPGEAFGEIDRIDGDREGLSVLAVAATQILKLGLPLLDALEPAAHARVVRALMRSKALGVPNEPAAAE